MSKLFLQLVSCLILIALILGAEAKVRRSDRRAFGKTRRIDSGSQVPGMVSVNLDTDEIDEARKIFKNLNLSLQRRVGRTPNWFIGQALPGMGPTGAVDQEALNTNPHVIYWELVSVRPVQTRLTPTDPSFPSQWNLRASSGSSSQAGVAQGADISVTQAWDLGYSGQGVHIQFIDDGLEATNAEFTGRYSLSSSWNYATQSSDSTPPAGNSHGTSCAGIAAAAMNNSYCGAGIAHRATVSGIRFIGTASTALVADVLTNKSDAISVSSNSWGYVAPLSDFIQEYASTFDAIFALFSRRIPVVFAAGNDNLQAGMCSRDEIISGPDTIAVGAVNDRLFKSAYSAECPNLFVTAPSSDPYWRGTTHLGIVAPTLSGGCSASFGGTSAACPTVSGVIALMKQANPLLEVRDIQHILAITSDRVSSSDASWVRNAAGVFHSDKFGFGRINATRAVLAAKTWNLVDPEDYTQLQTASPNAAIADGTGAFTTSSITVNAPLGSTVEHVGIFIQSDHLSPNHLNIRLTSPSGTTSILSKPFLEKPAFQANAGQLVTFASPYWAFPSIPNRISIAGYTTVYYSCDISSVATTRLSNRIVIVASDDPQPCTDAQYVAIINAASSKGYSAVFFFVWDTILNPATTTKSSAIPSIFVPLWQTNAWTILTSSTALNRLSNSWRPSTRLDFAYFGSWKSWGENPSGNWTLAINDIQSGTGGNLNSWSIQLRILPASTRPQAPPIVPPPFAPAPVAPPVSFNAPKAAPVQPTPVVAPQAPPISPPTAPAPISPPVTAPVAAPTRAIIVPPLSFTPTPIPSPPKAAPVQPPTTPQVAPPIEAPSFVPVAGPIEPPPPPPPQVEIIPEPSLAPEFLLTPEELALREPLSGGAIAGLSVGIFVAVAAVAFLVLQKAHLIPKHLGRHRVPNITVDRAALGGIYAGRPLYSP